MEQHRSTSTSRDTTSHQNGSISSSVKPKIAVEIDLVGEPVGAFAARFKTRSGELIRSHIPVNYTDWRNVPDNFKEDVWTSLMGEFKFNVDPNCCRAIIETGFPPLWRRYKSDLRDSIRGKRRRKKTKRSTVPEEGYEVQEEESE
ncbi:hypothetical protein MKX01_023173, partial [Papaver californicum]